MPLTNEQRMQALEAAKAVSQKAQHAADYSNNQQQLTNACSWVAQEWQQSQEATKILDAAAAAAVAAAAAGVEIAAAGMQAIVPQLMRLPTGYNDIINSAVAKFDVNRSSPQAI